MSGVGNAAVQEWWRPAAATPAPAAAAATDDGERGRASFRALLAFLFVLMLSPQSVFTFLQPLRIAFLSAGFAVFAYLMQRLSSREPLIDLTPAVKYAGFIVAWAVLTVPFSLWPGGSVSFLLEMYFKTLIIFLLLAHVIDSVPRLHTVAWALVLMAVPAAITGIENYLSGELIRGSRIFGYDAPLTKNPNDLALTMNLLLPLAIGLFLDAERFVRKALLAGVIVLLVAAIIATFSRSGFLTLGVVSTVYAWRLVARGRTGLVAVVVVLGIGTAPFVPGHYWERLSTITNIEADSSGSAQARWSDSFYALEWVGAHPIVGAGIGQNMLAMNEVRGDHWLKVHNVYLQYAVDLGLPGLVLYLMLLGTSIRNAGFAQRVAAYVRDARLFHLSESVRVSLIGFVVAAAFHPSGYHFYFYLLAGLALAVRAIANRRLASLEAAA